MEENLNAIVSEIATLRGEIEGFTLNLDEIAAAIKTQNAILKKQNELLAKLVESKTEN